MIKFNPANVTIEAVGEEHGLDLEREFDEYAPKIAKILFFIF